MFRKLKIEITVFLLVIVGIIGFFVYGRVREVQSINLVEAQLEVLKGIEHQLEISNCIKKANGDEYIITLCN